MQSLDFDRDQARWRRRAKIVAFADVERLTLTTVDYPDTMSKELQGRVSRGRASAQVVGK